MGNMRGLCTRVAVRARVCLTSHEYWGNESAEHVHLLRDDAAQVAQLLIPAAACALQQPERHGAMEEAGALGSLHQQVWSSLSGFSTAVVCHSSNEDGLVDRSCNNVQ